MVHFRVRLCAKQLLLLYYLGRISGACSFVYQSGSQSTRYTKLLTIFFVVLKTLIVLAFLALSLSNEPELYNLQTNTSNTFITNMSTIVLVSVLVSIKQLVSAEKYSKLFNEAKLVWRKIQNLESNQELLFTQTFFVVFLTTKATLNTFILIIYVPLFAYHNEPVPFLTNTLLIYLEFSIECFFTFPFIGLLVTASLLETLGKNLNNISTIRDLDRYSRVSKEFHSLFLEFVQLTEWDIFLLMAYYTSTIATSLMWYAQDSENWFDASYAIYATIFLLMFNVTADTILRYSRYREFGSSRFLTNDSMTVSSNILSIQF